MSCLVMRVPKRVSQCTKKGWAKLDLMPMICKQVGFADRIELWGEAHLVMDIMVVGVVPRHELQWIPWEGVAAVVVDGLEGGDGEEDHGLASG